MVVLCPKMNFNFKDSKQLTLKQRLQAWEIIKKTAIEYIIVIQNNHMVDIFNPKQVSVYAFYEAWKKRYSNPKVCIFDYEKIFLPSFQGEIISIVHGENYSQNVAAASILSKVTRDKIMELYDLKYPDYHFKTNKGYLTKKHYQSLQTYGVSQIHRQSYQPIKKLLTKNLK
jgi:ribonuclease HII